MWRVRPPSPTDPDEARPQPPPGFAASLWIAAGVPVPEHLRVPSVDGLRRAHEARPWEAWEGGKSETNLSSR